MLQTLAWLRIHIDQCNPFDGCLFTSIMDVPLIDIYRLLKRAWDEAGLKSRFTSTMISHTIVTSARDLKNDLSLEELKSLARAMDHSVKTAERVYQHNKQQLINDNTKIIESVLELNGRDNWYKEIQEGMEEEIEKGLLLGDIELKEEKEDKEETDEEDEADKKKKKKDLMGQKIGNRWRKFTNDEADLVRRLFRTYIEARVEKRDPISTKEIKKCTRQQWIEYHHLVHMLNS